MKRRIISFINQKGGVAKTTSTINVAAGLSLNNKKVLVIDFDPQGNLTKTLFPVDEINNSPTIYHLLVSEIQNTNLGYKDVVRTYSNGKVKFDVIPALRSLSRAEFELMSVSGREFFLKNQVISKIDDYDYILIDCQPSLGLLVTNVLCCSQDNELIIPVKSDLFSQMGLQDLFDVLTSLKKNLGIAQKDFMILITAFSENQTSDRKNANTVENKFPNKVFQTKIRKNTTLSNAHDNGFDVFNYSPESIGANDYMNLVKEIIQMEHNNDGKEK